MGEVLSALALCLASGTTEAYLHEALGQEQRQRVSAHWQGYLTATVSGSVGFASLVGSKLFILHTQAPVLAMLGALVVALIVVLQLPDVARTKRVSRKHPLRDMLAVAR